jgi:hypothetical protein
MLIKGAAGASRTLGRVAESIVFLMWCHNAGLRLMMYLNRSDLLQFSCASPQD